MSSPRRVDFEESLSPVQSSDAVLLRCRDTIERLHGDVEEERQKRSRLQEQLAQSESDLIGVKAALMEERQKCQEAENKSRRLETKVLELEQRVRAQKEMNETTSSQLQMLKTESIQKAQEHFSQSVRISDLEAALKRAEAKAAQEEAQLEAELEKARDVEKLQKESEEKGLELKRVLRHCQDFETRCESLQQDLEDVQADKQAIVESNQFELQELAMRQERLQAAWKEREEELQRAYEERDELQRDLEQGQKELSELRKQVKQLEELRGSSERLELELAKLRKRADDFKEQAQQKSLDLEELRRSRKGEEKALEKVELQRNEELSSLKADYARAMESLEQMKQQEVDRARILASERESHKRSTELTWRLEAANQELEASRSALAACKERCKELEEAGGESKQMDLKQLSEVLAQAQSHARYLAQVQSERAVPNEESSPFSRLKQKYEQKISKLYQHLCERDAYERKLKGFIENEVTALHEYNKELENVCRVRRSCAPRPKVDKVGRRLLKNLKSLEGTL